MTWFALVNRRKKKKKIKLEKKKNKKRDDGYADFFWDCVIGCADILIWPLRLVWFILRMLGRAILHILEVIGDIIGGIFDGI